MGSENSKKNGFMSWYFQSNLLVRILVAMILGIIVGLIFGPKILWMQPFGVLFVRLLQMIVVPVIFFSLIVGSSSLTPARLGRVGLKIFVYYMITTVLAVIFGLLFANIFKPGSGLNLSAGQATGKALTAPKVVDTLLNIVPTNPMASLASGAVLPIIFFAIVFGISLAFLAESEEERLKSAAAVVLKFFEGCAEATFKLVRGVMEYAPIGVFALIAVVFAQQGSKALGPLSYVTMTTFLAMIVHVLVTYGGALKLFGLGFGRFVAGAKEAMITAFVTRSSNATLPISMRNAEQNLGVPRSISSFTLPLGATINMDGTGIYEGVAALFVGFAIGLPLDFSAQMTIIITATLASIGAAGVPGAGVIMLLMVLNSVGLEVKDGSAVAMAYVMILGIDAILDMGRTCLNVTGDLVGTAIVAKTEKVIDESKWS